jgi:hypothetical protein
MSRDEDDCRGGREFRQWRRQRELELDDAVYGLPKETPPVVEPCRTPEPLTTPAELGSHNAAAARRAGCEDAYDNAIEAKYGKGW